MQNLQQLAGSTNHLVVFETAARHESFSRAATELGISQPAVSQSVRRLEQAIGIALFVRKHKKLQLTDAGSLLATEIDHGFSRVADCITGIQQHGHGEHVTLNVSSAFAHYWLVPRLHDFRTDHCNVDLRIQQTDRELDLASEGISLSVWRGHGHWPGYESTLLAEEILYPLASPGWVAENASIKTLEDLSQHDLITLEEPYRYRPGWPDFYLQHGIPFIDCGAGLRFNDYALVLQAGLAGDGVIFGWDHVTSDLVANGLLVRVTDLQWKTDAGFYLVWSARSTLSDKAIKTRDWIIAEK